MRALLVDSELSACSIRRILLADVCADLLQFEPDGRYGIPAGPEMFARKVSLFAVEPGDSYGALPVQKPDHGRYRVLGWNRNAHVYVVRHEVTLDDLAFLCRANAWKIAPNCVRLWPKMAFRRRLGTNTT